MRAAGLGCVRKLRTRPDLPHTVLTSAGQVRLLSAAQVRMGVPVRIQGILTYFDGISSYCFVQDSHRRNPGQLCAGTGSAGHRLACRGPGSGSSGGASPSHRRSAHIGPRSGCCCRADFSLPGALAGRRNTSTNEWPFAGWCSRSVRRPPGIVTLEIRAGRATVRARFRLRIAVIDESWTDADVRASGVLAESPIEGSIGSPGGTDSDALGSRTPAPSRSYIASADRLASLPVSKIEFPFGARIRHAGPAHRVRVRGVPYAPGYKASMAVMDESRRRSPCEWASLAPDPNASVLDVAGFLAWEDGHPVLDGAVPVDDIEVADATSHPRRVPR